MQKHASLNQDNDFFEVILNAIKNDETNPEFVDPIFMTVMKDPVVLSSGVVMDKSTVLDDSGNLHFQECPLTTLQLKPKVFPVNILKTKIIDWTKNRFKLALNLAKTYKNNYELALKATDFAKILLLDLGENVY